MLVRQCGPFRAHSTYRFNLMPHQCSPSSTPPSPTPCLCYRPPLSSPAPLPSPSPCPSHRSHRVVFLSTQGRGLVFPLSPSKHISELMHRVPYYVTLPLSCLFCGCACITSPILWPSSLIANTLEMILSCFRIQPGACKINTITHQNGLASIPLASDRAHITQLHALPTQT